MSRKVLIRLCKYILLFACFSKVLAPAVGTLFCNLQVKSICLEAVELETEDCDSKEDISKKSSVEDYFDYLSHFSFQKCVDICTLLEFTIANEAPVQCFYPDVLTPPPNV